MSETIHEEELLGKSFDAKLMRRLLSYARPYTKQIVLAVLAMMIGTGASLARPYIMSQAIDKDMIPMGKHIVNQQQGVTGIIHLGTLYLALIIVAFMMNFVQTYLLGVAVQKIIFDLRMALFSHVQRLDLAFFDKNPVGRLVTRVMNDCQTINDMFSNVLVSFFQDSFILVGIIVVLLRLNARLAGMSFIAIPFILASTIIYRIFARDAFRAVRLKLARINANLAENIAGMRIIQIFHQEQQVYNRFKANNSDYLQSSLRELLTFAVFRPSMDFIYTLTVSLILWYGGLNVIHNTLSFGILYAFVSYVEQFFQPINDLSEKYNLIQQAMASSERMFQLLDNQTFIHPATKTTLPNNLLGSVEFRNVWFAYHGEDYILKNLSFKIEPGQTVAFVGATGAGKSSILNLISRFYEISKGSILVDGVDIRAWPIDDLRRRVGIVLQDVFLFSGTIEDNIRLSEISITRQAVEQIVVQVNAKRFIDRLPGGLDYRVQERGSTFSSGERQLIAFARALAFNPNILVLDEATANIDTETEQWIQDALVTLTKNRTTIIVAHRLSTIQHADNIFVLHKGRLIESGAHQTLLSQQGMYWNLYRLQFQSMNPTGASIQS